MEWDRQPHIPLLGPWYDGTSCTGVYLLFEPVGVPIILVPHCETLLIHWTQVLGILVCHPQPLTGSDPSHRGFS